MLGPDWPFSLVVAILEGMLEIVLLSGKPVATLSDHDLQQLWVTRGTSIKALKQHLRYMLSQSRYRMQLAHCGHLLQDDHVLSDLGLPADLQLVLLPMCRGRAEELVEAAILGVADDVEALLSICQDPNETAWAGSTALVAAAGSGRMPIVSALVEAGADKDQTDHNGRSPLWAASENGHVETVRYLIDAGADTEKADKHGCSPLSVAAENGHLEVVLCLTEAGAAALKEEPHNSWFSAAFFVATAFQALSSAGTGFGMSCLLQGGWQLLAGA
mmetsp:Transcript_2561/g.4370  ORF Transcript_2561/g.4370 Transcript_2561/m.4370 type:complete len:273 (+) Transcript_2561:31-849(+)